MVKLQIKVWVLFNTIHKEESTLLVLFWTFYGVIFVICKSKDHRKLPYNNIDKFCFSKRK